MARPRNTEQVFTRIPAPAYAKLRRLAREQERSVADLTRRWILERIALELEAQAERGTLLASERQA